MLTYEESLAIREAFLARVDRLEKSATDALLAVYADTAKRIEDELARTLGDEYERSGAVRAVFGQGSETGRIAVIRGRGDFILEEFERFGRRVETDIRDLMPLAYEIGVGTGKEQVEALTGSFTRPNRPQIQQAVAALQEGTAQAAYFAEFARSSTQDAISTMVQGVVMGEHPTKIARRLAKKMDLGRSRLTTMTRTEVLGAARRGLGDSYRANADVLGGWIWRAKEDRRTCPVCWAMNGSLQPLDAELHSHPNCRCTKSPVTKTWNELRRAYGLPDSDTPETRKEPFDPDARFDASTSDEDKIKILGPGRYALWRDGQIRLGDLVQETRHPVWGPGKRVTTLRELRERGISPQGTIDRVAAAKGRKRLVDVPESPAPLIDSRDIAQIAPGSASKEAVSRVEATLAAIDRVHGISSARTWAVGKARGLDVVRNGKLPIRLRKASTTGNGGSFRYQSVPRPEYDAAVPIEIIARAHPGAGYSSTIEYEITVAHEWGHYIDTVLMRRLAPGQVNSNAHVAYRRRILGESPADDMEKAFFDFFDAVEASDTWSAIQQISLSGTRAYVADPEEVFARAYAQWISRWGGNADMKLHIRAEQDRVRTPGTTRGLYAWRDDEFDAIDDALTAIFRAGGMLR